MKRYFLMTLGGFFHLFLLLGCGGPTDFSNEYDIAPAPKMRVPESVLIGKEKYIHYCAPCHGLEGKGDGPNAKNLSIRPRNFNDIKSMKGKSDESLRAAIKEGGASRGLSYLMPPWGKTLTKEALSNLVEYVKTFQVSAK